MFKLAEQLANSTIELGDWPLSKILLKNEKHYLWFLLVPRKANIVELTDLTLNDQQQLLTEINQLTTLINKEFKPDKINIASIGNQVPQLHVHVVGRVKTDPLWPESIWQSKYTPQHYSPNELNQLIERLNAYLS